jgi:hypothetical protein
MRLMNFVWSNDEFYLGVYVGEVIKFLLVFSPGASCHDHLIVPAEFSDSVYWLKAFGNFYNSVEPCISGDCDFI